MTIYNDFITWNLKNFGFCCSTLSKICVLFCFKLRLTVWVDREKSVFFMKLKGYGCGCSFFKHQRFRAKTLQQGWNIYIYVQLCIQVFQRVIYGTQTHRWRGEGLQKSNCETLKWEFAGELKLGWDGSHQGNWWTWTSVRIASSRRVTHQSIYTLWQETMKITTVLLTVQRLFQLIKQ